VIDRVAAGEAAGVNLFLLQCSPQGEEMERFADLVIKQHYPQRHSAAEPPGGLEEECCRVQKGSNHAS
jgi:FMNH2-dependent dimethyl sulfone monooxygenase